MAMYQLKVKTGKPITKQTDEAIREYLKKFEQTKERGVFYE